MKRVKPLLPGIGIFCLALLVRVIYNNTVDYSYYPLHDSLFYQTIGLNLLREHCFCLQSHISTVYRAPLWPFIIAGISIIFGPNDYFARLFLCFIGSGTCVLIYLFARDLFSRRIGITAGIIGAIYPGLYIYDGWLYSESLYTFLLFAACYALYRIQRSSQDQNKRRLSPWIWCGILFALLSLTRPNGILVIGLFIVWAIVMVWQKILAPRVTAKGVIASTLIACALIVPWTVRNYIVSHSFIPVATGDGTVLLGSYNDMALTTRTFAGGFLGTWINPLQSAPQVTKPYPPLNCPPPCEVARETAYKDAAVQWIEHHLRLMPHLLKLHLINMWRPDIHEADLPTDRFTNQRPVQLVLAMMKTFPIPIYILAILGTLFTLWRWRELLFIYLMIALTIAQNIVFYGTPRFRAPIEPMLILLAAGAIWWLTHKEERTLRWMIDTLRKKDHTVKDEASEPSGSLAPSGSATTDEHILAGDM